MKIIDPHLHLFDLQKGDYAWLKAQNPPFWPDKPVIAKNFSTADLTLTPPLTLAGFVHIEAGFDNQQPWREITWLEDTMSKSSNSLAFRSVAMLDITLPEALFLQQLAKLMRYNSVVAIRHILDDNALAILSDNNSQHNLAILAKNQLSFELQMPLANTGAVGKLIMLLDAIPELSLCINHAGSPTYNDRDKDNSSWLQNLKRLAQFPKVYIKCSGYEMADRQYSQQWQQNVIASCIDSFGINRVMLASNFPLCLFHASYQETWLSNAQALNNTEQLEQLCFSNAHTFYKF
ncbi:MAG: amidohydrolase family protein [Cognaticolwellia sp.]